jgi:hypothetical protein
MFAGQTAQSSLSADRRDTNPTDHGILKALRDVHGIQFPTREVLVVIARIMGQQCDLMPGREIKRNRGLLVRWLDENYDTYKDLSPQLVLADTTGSIVGPQLAEWKLYCKMNPSNPALLAFETRNQRVK